MYYRQLGLVSLQFLFAVSVHTWEGPAALLDMEALACPSFRSLPFFAADQLVEKRIRTSV